MHSEPVTLSRLDAHHGPRNGLLRNRGIQAFPLQGGEQLGVPQTGDLPRLRIAEDGRCRDERASTCSAACLVSTRNRIETHPLQCAFIAVDAAIALDQHGRRGPARRHQQLTPAGLITARAGAESGGSGTLSKVAGRRSRPARSKGAAIANAGPTTKDIGTKATCPRPWLVERSERWHRESALRSRWSPMTKMRSLGTTTSNLTSDGLTWSSSGSV